MANWRRRSPTLFIVSALSLVNLYSQEPGVLDPQYIDIGVQGADVIVTGEFKVNWSYPWIDGWHYSGDLHVEEALYGMRNQQAIPFRWLEKYGNSCLICDHISRFDHKSGIWLLWNKNGSLRPSGTPATLCGGPLPAEARALVADAILRKKSNSK